MEKCFHIPTDTLLYGFAWPFPSLFEGTLSTFSIEKFQNLKLIRFHILNWVRFLQLKYSFWQFLASMNFFKHLENVIWYKPIPALAEGWSCLDEDRILLSLPVRLGVLELSILPKLQTKNFRISENLSAAVKSQQRTIPDDLNDLSRLCKLQIRTKRRIGQVETLEDLKLRMSPDQIRVNEIAK